MRIIAGKFRSRKLASDRSGHVRPTSGALREALFNIIGPSIEGARVLDVCAGTGAIGLEALSRGAASSTFIELARTTVKILKSNICSLQVEENTQVLVGDAIKMCERLLSSGVQYDIIFVDPPYYKLGEQRPALSEKIISIVDQGLLLPNGVLFVEEGSDIDLAEAGVKNLHLVKVRNYGTANLFRYERVD